MFSIYRHPRLRAARIMTSRKGGHAGNGAYNTGTPQFFRNKPNFAIFAMNPIPRHIKLETDDDEGNFCRAEA